MPGKCKFQDSWLSKIIYKDWLVKDDHDIHFARCRACCKSIKLQTMGEAALTSHAGGAGHKAAVRKLMEDGQTNGSEIQDSKEHVSICFQHDPSDEITGDDCSEVHLKPSANSTSHNAEQKDVTFPVAHSTAPGTASEKEAVSHCSTQRDTNQSKLGHHWRTDTLQQQQQMKVLEWENRMKVLEWEQELLKERMKAARQEEKAFRMKKAYYKAKLKRMGEGAPPSSSSSSDEEEKTSDPTG